MTVPPTELAWQRHGAAIAVTVGAERGAWAEVEALLHTRTDIYAKRMNASPSDRHVKTRLQAGTLT